ncbi:MAG: hypothetical protein HFI38_14010 [Lachnospiraceae bacterium]|jgi:hypothetical protein|nr:hypothetical protein [Lachnospiraceae bacterium]
MADILTNFLSWFFPDIVSIPAPVQVVVGSLFLALFFGLVLKITKR